MNIFGWLERQTFLGEVVQDYGTIQDESEGLRRIGTSIFLCRRGGRLQLVFRNLRTAPFAFRVHYTHIDVTPETLNRLGEILLDAHRHVDAVHGP